jgi:flagellar operon protein
MTNKDVNNILIPNVSKIPSSKKVNKSKVQGNAEEFKNLLNGQIDKVNKDHGINLSVHAAKRMNERDLSLDGNEFFKIKDAMNKLREKGGRDSLILTSNGAYIVDIPNNKIVTAIDKSSIDQNVFTKIDSTVVID